MAARARTATSTASIAMIAPRTRARRDRPWRGREDWAVWCNATMLAPGSHGEQQRARPLLPQVGGDLGDDQALGALREADHDAFARLQVLDPAAAQGLDVDEDVAGLALAHDEAVALGAVEPLDLGPLGRAGRLRRPARRPLAESAAAAAWTVEVAARAT